MGGRLLCSPPLRVGKPPSKFRLVTLITIPALKNEVFARDILQIWRVPLAIYRSFAYSTSPLSHSSSILGFKRALDALGHGKARQDAPRRPQDAAKTSPRRPKTPQDAAKTRQVAAKTPPRRVKITLILAKTPQDAPRRPKTPPRRIGVSVGVGVGVCIGVCIVVGVCLCSY